MPPRKHVPVRMCIGCQARRPKRELVRIVRTPEGEVWMDPTGKRSGRGAYICSEVECLKKAVSGGRLEKALQTEIDPTRLQHLQAELEKGIREGLLPARKVREKGVN